MRIPNRALLAICATLLIGCAAEEASDKGADVTQVSKSLSPTASVATIVPAVYATPSDPYDAAAQEILLNVNKALVDFYVVEIQTLREDWAIQVGQQIEAWHQHAEAWRQLVPPPEKAEAHARIGTRLQELEAIGDEIIVTVQSGQKDLYSYYVQLDPIEGQISANIDLFPDD